MLRLLTLPGKRSLMSGARDLQKGFLNGLEKGLARRREIQRVLVMRMMLVRKHPLQKKIMRKKKRKRTMMKKNRN